MGYCHARQWRYPSLAKRLSAEPLLMAKRYMSEILRQWLIRSIPDSKAIQQITGTRTNLATPLLREGVP